MADALVLYQAEWCPFSSAVREVLTELGLDFVARQVEPWPEQRAQLRAVAGSDQIPVLVAEDGSVHRGTREIFSFLRARSAWPYAAEHRRRFADHRDARETDVPGQLIEYFRGTAELDAAGGGGAEPVIVNNAEKSRYELRLGDRLVGVAVYRSRNGRIVLTHTEVDESCSGRGYGSALVKAALDDAKGKAGVAAVPVRRGLHPTPPRVRGSDRAALAQYCAAPTQVAAA